ncbi:MAG: hypothetical protein ACRC6I_20995, partial [Paracoccaceae bacterium]
MRAGLILSLTLMLAACQLAGPNADSGADALGGDEIEVTTLDEPVVGLAEEQASNNPETVVTGPAADVAAEEPLAEPSEAPAEEASEEPAAETVVEEPEVIDPALLTPEALACQRR